MNEYQQALQARIQAAYDLVPDYIKHDLVEAAIWARDTLRDKEGSGHSFHLHPEPDGTISCSFAKPEWAGDHSWSGMDEASEAIVIAVVSYLEGG